MHEKQIILIYPGLSDDIKTVSFLTQNWQSRFELDVRVNPVPWQVINETLETKLERALKLVDQLSTEADLISLIGISAGGSFALNLFGERLNKIHRVVNICGRLRAGSNVNPTLEKASQNKPAFKDSVLLAEQNAEKMKTADRQRVMTIRPRFGDEVVPSSTVALAGAHNITISTAGHMISIGYSLMFPQTIVRFMIEPR